MVQAGSDDWEIVPTHHDVLSCSDTETSEGGENDSRAAAAIIEAVEDNRQANLQVCAKTFESASHRCCCRGSWP
jgi:hypothetical protein